MNSQFLFEYANNFGLVLSLAYDNHYSLKALERQISYSKYFEAIENDVDGYSPLILEDNLLREVMPDLATTSPKPTFYRECAWVAESYLRIQGETRLTFECLFLYIPIEQMYRYFPIYHEMDFTRIIEEFNRLFSEKSVLSILIEKYKFSMKDLSNETGISYINLYSLKERKRNIKNMNALQAIRLAKLLNVKIETLCESKT